MSQENTNCLHCSYIGERKVKLCEQCKAESWKKYELCAHLYQVSEKPPPRRCENCQQEIDKNFNDFWRDIVTDERGELDLERIKSELFEFHLIIGQVSEVYDHITRGRVFKPTYYASVVINTMEVPVRERIKEPVEEVSAGD